MAEEMKKKIQKQRAIPYLFTIEEQLFTNGFLPQSLKPTMETQSQYMIRVEAYLHKMNFDAFLQMADLIDIDK